MDIQVYNCYRFTTDPFCFKDYKMTIKVLSTEYRYDTLFIKVPFIADADLYPIAASNYWNARFYW